MIKILIFPTSIDVAAFQPAICGVMTVRRRGRVPLHQSLNLAAHYSPLLPCLSLSPPFTVGQLQPRVALLNAFPLRRLGSAQGLLARAGRLPHRPRAAAHVLLLVQPKLAH